MDRMSISKAEHLKAVKDFAWTAWVWLMWSTAGEMGLLCRAEMKMWLCWDGNRLFQQWVLPLSLWCSIDSFFISWLRHSGTAANSKAPHFFFFFLFLCQLISRAIMRDAETSLGPTDYRAPGSSTAAGQNMTSPFTNAMRGQTPPREGLSCGRYREAARTSETESRVSQQASTDWEIFQVSLTKLCTALTLLIKVFFSVLVENCCVREVTLKLFVAAEGTVWSQPSLSSLCNSI